MAYFDSNTTGTCLVRRYHGQKYPSIEGAKAIGRLYAWHGSVVNARDFGLKSIIELQLTADNPNLAFDLNVSKWIFNPAQVDNYASIWIRDTVGAQWLGVQTGSIWINFEVYGV